MKKTLRLDAYLTENGELKLNKSVLRGYYKKLSKGETKKDKETKIKLNLVLYPDFFYKSSKSDPAGAAEEMNPDHEIIARIQNTSMETIKILHDSQGIIKSKDFSKKVCEFSKCK